MGECPTREKLLAFVDGQLGRDEVATLRPHLASCESCRRVWATLETQGSGEASGVASTIGPGLAGRPVALGGAGGPAEAAPLETGTRIGHYVVQAAAGAGGWGEVYRALDERLDRQVALKLLPERVAASVERQARLLREAKTLAALNHPGIVTLFELGVHAGRVFLVMELVDGEPLGELAGRLEPAAALRLVAEAADALGAAHVRGILHRDVKPDNLMRTADGRIKVLDFGLAKLWGRTDGTGSLTPSSTGVAPAPGRASGAPGPEPEQAETLASAETLGPVPPSGAPLPDLTRAGALVGTPAYMSPEQADGHPLDARSEVFSLGAVLWELLAGRRLFARATIGDTLAAIRACDVARPSSVRPGKRLPAAVDAVVMRALDRDPARRFPDMASFARAARAAANPRRGRRALVLGAVAFLGVATLAAGLLVRGRGTGGPQRPDGGAAVAVTVTSNRRLTFDPGCEEYPSFGPEGKTLLFDADVGRDYHVFALDLETGARRQLTRRPGTNFAATISPDGAWVAYIASDSRGRRLEVVPASGAGAAPPRELEGPDGLPHFAADGRLLGGHNEGYVYALDLREAAPTPRRVAALPAGQRPAAVFGLRDGSVVVGSRPQGKGDQLTISHAPPGQVATPLARLRMMGIGMALGPGGRSVYAAGQSVAHRPQLVRVALPGGEQQVVAGLEPASGIAVSPDGRRLVYSTCQEIASVHRVRPGAAPVPLLPGGRWADDFAVPAGRNLVVGSNRAGADQLFLADLATGQVRPITPPGAFRPAVSPDGSLVAFEDRLAGGIAVVPLAGGAVRRLTTERGDLHATFTHDGREVVFSRAAAGGSRVHAVPVGGGPLRTVGLEGASEPHASPTEDRLVYSRLAATGRTLMTSDLRGQGERLVDPKLPVTGHVIGGFSPDGKRLLVASGAFGELHEVTVDGAAPLRVIKVPGERDVSQACYAPDGDGYVVVLSRWEGDLWLAEGSFP
jgi:serine/threonine protein kinase/Tol biopolymer transport system component